MSSRRKGFANRVRNDDPSAPTIQQLDKDIMGVFDRVDHNRPRDLAVEDIVIDQEVQVRIGGLDEDHVETLVAILQNGGEFRDPIEIIDVEGAYYVADGFHRLEATTRVGQTTIKAKVRPGSYHDALTVAEDGNLKHGLILDNKSKKRLLWRRLQRGHEWLQWSFNAIASELGITDKTVKAWFEEFATSENSEVDRTQTVGADGKVRDTSNIGGQAKPRLFHDEVKKQINQSTRWLTSLPPVENITPKMKKQTLERIQYLRDVLAALEQEISQ